MEHTMTRYLAIVCLPCVALLVGAGEPQAGLDFKPRAIQFPSEAITLKDALAAIVKQTGNQVADLRKVNPSNPMLTLKTTATLNHL